MLKNWRNGLMFFLAWLLFEDLARKYLGNNMAIYFGKDVLVAVVYLSFFLAYRRREVPWIRPPFLLPLLIMIWIGIIQIFNPGSPRSIVGYGGRYSLAGIFLFLGFRQTRAFAMQRLRIAFPPVILALGITVVLTFLLWLFRWKLLFSAVSFCVGAWLTGVVRRSELDRAWELAKGSLIFARS